MHLFPSEKNRYVFQYRFISLALAEVRRHSILHYGDLWRQHEMAVSSAYSLHLAWGTLGSPNTKVEQSWDGRDLHQPLTYKKSNIS